MHFAREPRQDVALTTAAVHLPVTLQESKALVGIDDDDESDDATISGMIRAATEACERYTGRTFVNTTWTLFQDRFPGRKLEWWDGVRQMADTELTDLTDAFVIPRPPLVSITSIKSNNQDGTTTTVVASDYIVDTASEPGRVALKISKAWPSTALRAIHGVEVEFVAGYGPVGSDVPEPIRQAILMTVADMVESRSGTLPSFEKTGDSTVARPDPSLIPIPAVHLLGTYKVYRL